MANEVASVTTTTTVAELVVQHLIALQQEAQSQDVVVGAAIVKFQTKVEELSLTNQLSGLSVSKTSDDDDDDDDDGDDDDDDDDNDTQQSQEEEVTAALLTCIDCILLSFDGSTSSTDDTVTLMLDFICGIAALPLYPDALQQLVEHRAMVACAAALDRTRVFGCRLIRAILLVSCPSTGSTASSSSNTDSKVCSQGCQVKECSAILLPRMTDKAQSVRLAAIHACAVYQHSHSHHSDIDTDTIQAVQEALRWSLAHDPSVSNRCAALQSMSVPTATTTTTGSTAADDDDDSTSCTLDLIIARLRDVKVKVRVAAVEKLMLLEIVMTPHQCATIVRAGLMTDRCKETSDATTVLLCTRWIKQAKYDPLVLLSHLNPSVYEQECETVIQTLLKVANDTSEVSTAFIKDLSDAEIRAFRQGMNSSKVLNTLDAWKPETLLVARLQCDQTKLSPAKKADLLSKVVPDIPLLCDAIQHCIDTLANLAVDEEGDGNPEQEEAQIFICNQLFKLAQLMDLKEEGSRRHFVAACKVMLTSIHTPEELLEEAIKAMSAAHDREDDYLQSVSDIVDRMTQVGIDNNDDTETQCLIQLRVVSILTIVLENTSPRMALHPSLKSFVQHVVPAVTSQDALIREAGVGCLGRLALLSQESNVLVEFKPLFLQVISRDEESMEIRAQAMLALCDLAMLFDNILVPIDDVTFLDVVSDMLQHGNPSVVAVAAEVSTKLLFSGKVHDATLLAALLVVFFNKAYDDYEDDDMDDVQEVGSVYRMQQLLSLFFSAYSMKSQQCKSTLVGAISPMLGMVATKKKKRGGTTKTWPIAKMIEFVYSVAEVGTKIEEEKEPAPKTISSSSNALLVCLGISTFLVQHHDNLTNTNLRTLCKLLGGADVDVDVDEDRSLVELKEKVNELTMLISDEASLESLETMMELLEEVEEEVEEADLLLVDAMENVALDKENGASTASSKSALDDDVEVMRSALSTVN